MTGGIILNGKLKIGAWQEAWHLDRALMSSSIRKETRVLPVIAAPWKRSTRTDWVWRLRDREYEPNVFGGTCDTPMGGGWGRELFATEVEAWAYAVGTYRTWIRKHQRKVAEEIEMCAIELGEAVANLRLARHRDSAPKDDRP
jgi:hypothetical protein